MIEVYSIFNHFSKTGTVKQRKEARFVKSGSGGFFQLLFFLKFGLFWIEDFFKKTISWAFKRKKSE
jgi:hypothetical protein